jgi:hypothetical protein
VRSWNERIRSRCRAASLVAILAASALLIVACEHAGEADPPVVAGASEQPAAPEAARIGAAGSACDLPVTFGIAASWRPKAVALASDEPLAELGRRYPLTLVCEIDAKPAGSIGFLRVWTGGRGPLRASLAAFIGTDAIEPVFTELRVGGRLAVEVVYQQKSELDDAMDQERAFLVETTTGIAAISLDSFDNDEHTSMLPAYQLAKSGLTVTG